MTYRSLAYDQIAPGDTDSLDLLITDESVRDFARLVGDSNPVHLDEEFAAKSFFRRRVAHGMLAAGLISAVLGTRLPGPGAIYLTQELEFKRPVFIGDTLTAKVEVLEKHDRHKKIKLRTWVENQDGQIILDGSATVLVRGATSAA